MSETFKPVAYTSKIMAAIRAVEHERPNRLFTDPYAAELAGEDTIIKAISKIQENEDKGMPYVEVRTRYFDDWLKSIANKIKQIVILGAGLDTRAYRINLPASIHLYELDQAEVIEYKNTILHKYSSSCHRVSLASDLRKVWSENLISAGYQTNVPTAWLIEGLFYYLTEEEVKNILEQINKLSLANSYLAADFINKANLKNDDDLVKYWQFGCDDPQSFLKIYGWECLIVQPCDESANYGRFTFQFPPLDIEDTARNFFSTGSKKIGSPEPIM